MALSPDEEDAKEAGDVFAPKGEDGEGEEKVHDLGVPDTFEELPIEIRSLTERYTQSIVCMLHTSPL